MRLLFAAASLCVLAGCASPPAAPPAQARNVIFFLGDGMGINTLTAARIYAVGEEGELTIDTLPESAFVKTFSNNAQTTDSAAAMSAYMTGKKADNGVISMASPCRAGAALPTLLELAKRRGMAAGVVSTQSVTDATPAATYAHVCDRHLEGEIARQLAQANVDVVFGGGAEYFGDLLPGMAAKGYRVVADSAQLKNATAPVIGLFAQGGMHFDAERDPAKEPSLAEMATKAIGLLAPNPKGFFLMVEGGRIDVALHDTRAKRALQETVAFDQAIKAAIDQMRVIDPGLKNTLVVVTADHDHTLLLNGYAKRTGKTTATEPGVLGLVRNVGDGKPRLDKDGAPMTIIGFGTGSHRVKGSRGDAPPLTDAIVSADDYHQEAVIPLESWHETHGGSDVFLGAIGAGAERFRGTIDNTRVFGLIQAAAGWQGE